jgi:hypothetical protein
MSSINERLEPSHPDYRPAIDFDLYRDIIEEFKESYIFHQMRTIEDRNAMYVNQSQDLNLLTLLEQFRWMDPIDR